MSKNQAHRKSVYVADRKSCDYSGKSGYSSKKQAINHSNKFNGSKNVRAYFCKHCNSWHITTQEFDSWN